MPIRTYLQNKSGGGFTIRSNKKHFPPSLELEPFHQTIRLTIDIAQKFAKGTIDTTVRSNVNLANKLEFDAINLELHTIEGPETWSYDGQKIHCQWDIPFQKGEERHVIISYTVSNPISGMFFNTPDTNYPDRVPYCITDNESERARYWLPCIDHLSVRCSVEFFLTGLKQYVMIANGKKINELDNADGTKTVHWKQAFPCPSYLLSLAIGDFIEVIGESVDMGNGTIPVAYYTTSNFSHADLQRSFARTPKYLEWMAKKWDCNLGWDKYYQIATSLHGGAMENISLVTWNDFAISDEKLAKEMQPLVDIVNVHEMAHSWFGDMIVCKEFSHAWLKESWATYVESIYYEENHSMDEAYYHRFLDAETYIKEADSKYMRPIVSHDYDHSWSMYDMHLYPGGSWRLHMLRNKMGSDLFFDATRDYLRSYRGDVVETVDFRRKCENHSGKNLEAFFDQWFYSKGYPDLKAEYEFDDDNHLALIKLSQKQVNKDKQIPVFHFPITIQWQSDDLQWHTQSYQIKEKNQTCYISCEKKPLQIYLDPDNVLLCKMKFNPGIDILKHHISGKNLIVRIRAAKELGEIGSNEAVKIITTAYRNETFWGAKIQFVIALVKSHHAQIPEILEKMIKTEQNPLVLHKILSELINYRNPHISNIAKWILSQENQLYWVSFNALQIIGSQRNQQSFEFLMNYSMPPDFRGIIEGGYYRAIGRIRNQKAIDYLSEKIKYGIVPDYVRVEVIEAFADSLSWLERPKRMFYIERLLDLITSEQNEKIILKLVKLFENLGDDVFIGSLLGIKSKTALQFHDEITRAINSIENNHAKPNKKIKLYEEKLEKMAEKLGTLLNRIEKLENLKKSENNVSNK